MRAARTPTHWLAAVLVMIAVSAVTACGDDDDGGRPEPAEDQAAEVEPKPIAQWREPSGEFEGQKPRAAMILIHGGGWSGTDRDQFQATLAQGPLYETLGYGTMTVDYRGGADGLADLERFYDETRARVGPGVPICAIGSSAGGHMALMLATREPDLACAVDLAGPTNLAALAEQSGGAETYEIASEAFGAENLERFSPTLLASKIRALLFVAGAANDPLLPTEQIEEIAQAVPGTETVVLPAGEDMWVHSPVDAQAKQAMDLAIASFLDRVASSS